MCTSRTMMWARQEGTSQRYRRKRPKLTQTSGQRAARSAPPSLCSSPPLPILPSLGRAMILSTPLRLPPPLDTSTREEGCSRPSRHITAVLIRIPPIQHPVMLLFKKLPVHHKHPPFYVPPPEREGGKERNQPSLKHKLTALSRLTWRWGERCAVR